MNSSPDILAGLEYPGRLIGLGANAAGTSAVIVYAITGRSPSSQARKLVFRDNGIWVRPTDEAVLKTGNVDLLVYPAILFDEAGIAVSNGKQTADVRGALGSGLTPAAGLAKSLEKWDYEPDSPIFTPRISGAVVANKAGLSVIRRGGAGESLRSFFEFPMTAQAPLRIISTYLGPNRDPLPCFEGEPRLTGPAAGIAREMAERVYADLGPKGDGKDFRVAVACVFATIGRPSQYELHIINRHERT